MIEVLEAIKASLKKGFELPDGLTPEVRTPPNRKLGDLAIPMFQIAKHLSRPPAAVGAEAAKLLGAIPGVESANLAGPYVNLVLDRPRFARQLCADIATGRWADGYRVPAGTKVVLEHTSINPNASPHVGRARNAMLGDCLARLLRVTGHDVHVLYYVNDMGKQIALLVMGCRGKSQVSFDQLLQTYIDINARAEADPALEQEAFALLRAFEDRDPAAVAEFRRVTELCLEGQRAILARLGITYDAFLWESDYAHDSFLELVSERLRARGALFVDEQSRTVADLQALGFSREEGRYIVLRRANGSSLYFLRDLAFNKHKAEMGTGLDLIVLGEDHKLYFEQLRLVLEAAGVRAPEPVYYSYVLLREGKMSTRKGNLILLTDFLDEATRRARERVREANPSLDGAELDRLAAMIGTGAVKFSILRVTPSNNVSFDWDQALTFEGDSGPYLQYSCARIRSIFERGGIQPSEPATWPPLEDEEWELVLALMGLGERIAAALAARSPALLADFALGVARKFNRFYHSCPVLSAPPDVAAARIWLCHATWTVLKQVLDLLGIEPPERM